MKRRTLALGLLVSMIGLGLLAGCVNMALPLVDERGAMTGQAPASLSPFDARDERQRAQAKRYFETSVYGAWPGAASVNISQREVLDADAYQGRAVLERLTIVADRGDVTISFPLFLATPKAANAPAPLFVMQSFCGERAVFNRRDIAPPSAPYPSFCDNQMAQPAIEYVFGRYIGVKPVADFIDQGVAFASFYAGEVVPDEADAGRAALVAHFSDVTPAPGAIMAWAWAFSLARQALDSDPRLDARRTTVYGHSRHAKAALLAAAFDPEIDRAIAHQSGRGGASLNQSETGESIAQITTSFPHWFNPAFAEQDPRNADSKFDQHALIALVAPRALLLGNGRRDTWSDPGSAWIAARMADTAYEAYGSRGLDQETLGAANMDADLIYYLRNGRHGETAEDFRRFVAFSARP
jgi:hypothetical protein